ncbi:DUF2059 domain-containing protein [Desulfovibrio sp. JC022]|uniref:DUF2059 domain-containing protein n=1 Tax=Desulfovibrio sp. JC022 TaxID=2593642 RepID=UPI0013D7C6FC|nr:DUF2059 domain-containing protein [Desulfovibrio sp. JC022]NDV23799.1 DUF2059 domain-containing protein [Desulfovibrio sp. JC022]
MVKFKSILLCLFAIIAIMSQTIPASAQKDMRMKAAQELEKETFDIDDYYNSFGYIALMKLKKEMNKNPATSKYEKPLFKALVDALDEAFYDDETLNIIERARSEILYEEFNEKELKELLVFAKTPVGKKFMARQRDLVHKTENKMAPELNTIFSNKLNQKFNNKIELLIKTGTISENSAIKLE